MNRSAKFDNALQDFINASMEPAFRNIVGAIVVKIVQTHPMKFIVTSIRIAVHVVHSNLNVLILFVYHVNSYVMVIMTVVIIRMKLLKYVKELSVNHHYDFDARILVFA